MSFEKLSELYGYVVIRSNEEGEEGFLMVWDSEEKQKLFRELQVDPKSGHAQIANYYLRLTGAQQIS